MKSKFSITVFLFTILSVIVMGCGNQSVAREVAEQDDHHAETHVEDHSSVDDHHEAVGAGDDHHHDEGAVTENLISAEPDIEFTLRTDLSNGMSFLGESDAIAGVSNPTLRVKKGDIVKITLINGDNVEHNVVFPAFGVHSAHVVQLGENLDVIFEANEVGTFTYQCTLPGHFEAGMTGQFIVEEG